eukprot:jgi/Orpsp1_1/1176262/evm.model.c7180000056985.1
MKIILLHFIFRTIGDIFNEFGGLFNNYYANSEYGECVVNSNNVYRHPLKWLLTRQIATIFWNAGEIFADWYPLLRTKAVANDRKSIRFIYISCALYNLFKIALCFFNFSLSPTELYDNRGVFNKDLVKKFYFKYWILQVLKLHAAIFYEFSVYVTIKKCLNKLDLDNYNIGFVKKFKNLSLYRILIFTFISVIFLPIFTLTIIIKIILFFKAGFTELDFSLDEIRRSLTNVQYYLIFIDQIFLFISKYETIPLNSFDSKNNNSFIIKNNFNKKKEVPNMKLNYNNINDTSAASLISSGKSDNDNKNGQDE